MVASSVALASRAFDVAVAPMTVVRPLHRSGPPHWTLPGEARLLVTRGSGRIATTIGNRHYDSLPAIAIVGPTSKPRLSWNDQASLVEVPLTALDWCRLTTTSADTITDRIVTPDQLDMGAFADDLAMLLTADQSDDHVVQIVRALIADHVVEAWSNLAPQVWALMRVIEDTMIVDATVAADQVGVAPHTLRRVALRQFGFPAKTVLIRRRFLLAMERFRESGMDMGSAVACGYFDSSHFLRDAKRFLGMTPRRFLASVHF